MSKEAKARIKINKLLEEAGWCFFDTDEGTANIILEKRKANTARQAHWQGTEYKTSGAILYFWMMST